MRVKFSPSISTSSPQFREQRIQAVLSGLISRLQLQPASLQRRTPVEKFINFAQDRIPADWLDLRVIILGCIARSSQMCDICVIAICHSVGSDSGGTAINL